jgi:hypothetical protein
MDGAGHHRQSFLHPEFVPIGEQIAAGRRPPAG